jgi:hypothetical protein
MVAQSLKCTISAAFITADGEPKQGVLVRFTPTNLQDRVSANAYFVASEVTAESDEDGLVEFDVLRNLRGTLTVTGVPLSREVIIPDAAEADLFGLIEAAQDPLAVIDTEFFFPPRRS